MGGEGGYEPKQMGGATHDGSTLNPEQPAKRPRCGSWKGMVGVEWRGSERAGDMQGHDNYLWGSGVESVGGDVLTRVKHRP